MARGAAAESGSRSRDSALPGHVHKARTVILSQSIARHRVNRVGVDSAVSGDLLVQESWLAEIRRESTQLLRAVTRALHRRYEIRFDLCANPIELTVARSVRLQLIDDLRHTLFERFNAHARTRRRVDDEQVAPFR